MDLYIISQDCCPWLKGVSWLWAKVISSRSRSQCTVMQKPCPGHYSLLYAWNWILFHRIVYMTQGCVMTLTQVIFPRSGSQCTQVQKPCPCHNSLLYAWNWILFQRIVVHDPMVCHDLDPRSYHQGQGRSVFDAKHFLGHNFLLHAWIWILFQRIVVLDPRVVMKLTQGNISKVTRLLNMTRGCVIKFTKAGQFAVH